MMHFGNGDKPNLNQPWKTRWRHLVNENFLMVLFSIRKINKANRMLINYARRRTRAQNLRKFSGKNWAITSVDQLLKRINLTSVTGCPKCSNNSNSNSHDNVYGAVIIAVHCHCESSPGSCDKCSMQCRVAANLWTKPISLSQ